MAVVVLVMIFGVIYTPWLIVVAIAFWFLVTAAKVTSLRREAEGSVASHMFELKGAAPDIELVALFNQLGVQLVTARGWVRRCANYLDANQPRTIARELKKRRASALTAANALEIDALARELDALDVLAERRAELLHELRRFASRVDGIRDTLFEVRLGRTPREDLVTELRTERETVGELVLKLREQLVRASPNESLASTRTRRSPLRIRILRGFKRHALFVGLDE
jgi:hypothetical protein